MNVINGDCMWYYVEGVKNFVLIWEWYGIWILFGFLSFWFDVIGVWLLILLFFGFDMFGMFEYLCVIGYDYSWFVFI